MAAVSVKGLFPQFFLWKVSGVERIAHRKTKLTKRKRRVAGAGGGGGGGGVGRRPVTASRWYHCYAPTEQLSHAPVVQKVDNAIH